MSESVASFNGRARRKKYRQAIAMVIFAALVTSSLFPDTPVAKWMDRAATVARWFVSDVTEKFSDESIRGTTSSLDAFCPHPERHNNAATDKPCNTKAEEFDHITGKRILSPQEAYDEGVRQNLAIWGVHSASPDIILPLAQLVQPVTHSVRRRDVRAAYVNRGTFFNTAAVPVAYASPDITLPLVQPLAQPVPLAQLSQRLSDVRRRAVVTVIHR